MRFLSALVLLILTVAFAAPAVAGEPYSLATRPELVFKGGTKRITPYPQGKRSTAVWSFDSCWRGCTSSCNWTMVSCIRASDADLCRPHLDACDRSCQRSCRSIGAGPLLGFVDW